MTAPRKRSALGSGPPLRISQTDAADGTPLHRQIYLQLRERMASGSLASGARVPASRVLARELRVSRNTVEGALRQLQAEGWIVRRVGSGSRVADRDGA